MIDLGCSLWSRSARMITARDFLLEPDVSELRNPEAYLRKPVDARLSDILRGLPQQTEEVRRRLSLEFSEIIANKTNKVWQREAALTMLWGNWPTLGVDGPAGFQKTITKVLLEEFPLRVLRTARADLANGSSKKLPSMTFLLGLVFALVSINPEYGRKMAREIAAALEGTPFADLITNFIKKLPES